jgi:phospholipid-binding lipoprotein MlaA
MKTQRLLIPAWAALIICFTAGCATHTVEKKGHSSQQIPLVAAETPLQLASTEASLQLDAPQQTALTEEEEALFEDDLDAWDEEQEDEIATVADPLEWFNRAMFHFTDKLYFWILKPVASGYRAVTPKEMRIGVDNFFTNLGAPVRLTNCILQGEIESAEAELAKFLYNITIGVLGFGNPARKHPKLNPDPEDFGQTLATYGIGDGFYIFWPILGPSTLRDSLGRAGDYFLSPPSYVNPAELSIAVNAYDRVNATSLRIGDYEALRRAAIDPYEALRNGYIQLRQSRIKK